MEDYDLWLRIAAISEIFYLPEALLDYREHATTVRTDMSRSTYWISMITSLQNLDAFLDSADRHRALVRRIRAQYLANLARARLAERHPGSAARSLAKAAFGGVAIRASAVV